MMEDPTPRRPGRPVPLQTGACRPAGSPSIRGRRRTRTPTVTRSPDFESGTASMTVSSSMAEDGVIETHSQGATRIPDGGRTLAASSSTAESGRLERHGRSRALVSSEARHPGRFALHGLPRTVPRIRPANLLGLSQAPLPNWARTACERIPGIGPGPSPWQGDALPLRYIRIEPLPGVEPGDVSIPRTRGRRSEGRELTGPESNQRRLTVQPLPTEQPATGAPDRFRTDV
jgi:hypothetical protein